MVLRFKLLILDNLIWGLVLGFFILNALFTPQFATYDNVLDILFHSSAMSMLVLAEGLVLVIGALDLSIDSIAAFAPGIVCLMGLRWAHLDPISMIILTLVAGALIGALNGWFVAVIKLNPFVETLAMEIVLRGLVLFLVPISLFPLPYIYQAPGSLRVLSNVPVAVFIMLAVYSGVEVVMRYTTFGRRFVATGGNPRASFIAGINTRRMIIAAFMLAGLLAGVAGLLIAGRQGSISNTMAQNDVIMAFAGAILGGATLQGGKGAPVGMLGGALLLGMISNALNLLGVGVTLVYATEGALIFVAVVIDRVREKVRVQVLKKEQVKRFRLETMETKGGDLASSS